MVTVSLSSVGTVYGSARHLQKPRGFCGFAIQWPLLMLGMSDAGSGRVLRC